MRTPAGFFMPMKNNNFDKPPFSIDEQIDVLISRGLVIHNNELAKHYLNFISYYRFCAYAMEYENAQSSSLIKSYREGTTFEQVLDCYVFDRLK